MNGISGTSPPLPYSAGSAFLSSIHIVYSLHLISEYLSNPRWISAAAVLDRRPFHRALELLKLAAGRCVDSFGTLSLTL